MYWLALMLIPQCNLHVQLDGTCTVDCGKNHQTKKIVKQCQVLYQNKRCGCPYMSFKVLYHSTYCSQCASFQICQYTVSQITVCLPVVWGQWHFQTFVWACLRAAPASFLTIKSAGRKETGWGWNDKRQEGWKELKRYMAQRRDGWVSPEPHWACATVDVSSVSFSTVVLTVWWHLHLHSFAESDSDPSLAHTSYHPGIYTVAAEWLSAAKRDPFRLLCTDSSSLTNVSVMLLSTWTVNICFLNGQIWDWRGNKYRI